MDILITKKNNSIVIPESINFAELVRNSNTTLTLSSQSKMIDLLTEEFTEQELQWYIANLYIYLNYHPTDEYPISLENVYRMLGFANKGNAMKTIKGNFLENEDYKIIKITKDLYEEKAACPDGKAAFSSKNLGGAGLNREEVMLNVDTFKNLAMIVKTPKGTEIRKYYIKMENIHNKVVKIEIETTRKLLEEKDELHQIELSEKDKVIEHLENKPDTYGFERIPGFVYTLEDTTKPGHTKVGYSTIPNDRVSSLNVGSSTYSLKILATFETFDKEFAEKIIHYSLNPFRIKNRKEWFYFKNSDEMIYGLNTIKSCIEFIKKFDIKEIPNYKDVNLVDFLVEINKQNVEKANEKKEIQKKNRRILSKTNAEKASHQTDNFKGTTFAKDKELWKSEVQHDNKRYFLGYFTDEVDAAKVYNDYVQYLNENEDTNFVLNKIPGYLTVARNIPEKNKEEIECKKSSKYNGVSFDKKRKFFVAGITCARKIYNLGNNKSEIECAKLYNQQALFFNNTLNTVYILNEIENYITIPKDISRELIEIKENKKSSKYYGVSITTAKKWASSYMLNRKKIHIGTFKTELEACQAYNNIVIDLNKNGCNYKVNKII